MISSIVHNLVLVSFLLNSCSAAKSSILIINESTLNVIDFGASPKEGNDDTPAFEKAIKSLKSGQTLFIPNGIYELSKPLLITTSNISITGESKQAILRFDNSYDWHGKYFPVRVGMINVIADTITFQNVTFDQNFRGSKKKDGDLGSIACIVVGGKYLGKPTHTKNIKVVGCEFYDYYSDAISVFNARTENILIENNKFISAYIVGEWKVAGVKGEQAIGIAAVVSANISNNIIEGALDDAIAIHVNSKDVLIENNNITTTGGRILINGVDGGVVQRNTITYIQDGGTGILISFEAQAKRRSLSSNIVVRNNKIQVERNVKVSSGIEIFGCGDNIKIENNELFTHDAQGIGIRIRDRKHHGNKGTTLGNNIVINNNTIENFIQPTLIDLLDQVHQNNNIQINQVKGNTSSKSQLRKSLIKQEEVNNKSITYRIARIEVGTSSISVDNFMRQSNNQEAISASFILDEKVQISKVSINTDTSKLMAKSVIRIIDTKEKQKSKTVRYSNINNTFNFLFLPNRQYRISILNVPSIVEIEGFEVIFQ